MGQGTVAADELRLLIERAERLEEEKKGVADDIKDVMAEAKARGYDTKAIRAIMRIRKKRKEEFEEEQAILETYMAALGMLPDHEPARPRTSKVPTPIEEAIADRDPEATISVNGGPAVPLSTVKKALDIVRGRPRSLVERVGDALEEAVEGTGATVHRNVRVG